MYTNFCEYPIYLRLHSHGCKYRMLVLRDDGQQLQVFEIGFHKHTGSYSEQLDEADPKSEVLPPKS